MKVSRVACVLLMVLGCEDRPPPVPPPQLTQPPPPQVAAISLEHVAVYGAVSELAHAAGLTAVIDPNASEYAMCARVTIVVPTPRPVEALVGLVADALRPSGFLLTREPAGLMLRYDGSPAPPGCEGRLANEMPASPGDEPSADDAPPPTPEDLDRAIRAVSDTEYLILADAVEGLFSDRSLMRSARVIPQMEDGRAHGLRVYGVRTTSLAGRLGIRNGDTILAVNGRDLSGPEAALQAFSALGDATRFEVEIVRAGERRTHVYRIVERLPRR